MHDLSDLSVVITGASSGVGRSTAHAFARRRARLALAARARGPLEETARECREQGGQAITVPTDVTDSNATGHLADEANRRLGGIDVWVNNAGVGAIGRFDEVPIEAHRRTIETNLIGYMNGAHAVLPHFKRQDRGILINNVSIGGFVPTPFAAAYAASKFGVRAFSNSLRQELGRWPGIQVCAVYPYFMDTPGVEHGANYTGRALQPAPPVYAPETTAKAIVSLVEHPRRQVIVGVVAKLAALEYSLAPTLTEWALGRFTELYLAQADWSPDTDGNLNEPMPDRYRLHGGWRWSWPRGWSGGALALCAVGGVAAAALAAGAARKRGHRSDRH